MNYISMSDYAKIAGISRTAAYNRAKGSLKEFVHTIDGNLYFEDCVLDMIQNNESELNKTLDNKEPIDSKKSNNIAGLEENLQEKETLITSLQTTLASKEELIISMHTQYQAQLAAKDETISTLQAQVQSQQEQLDKLAELLAQEQKLHLSAQLVAVQSKPSFWQKLFHKK